MNTTTKAQRINKRQDEIWDKAKRAQAETAATVPEAPRKTLNGRVGKSDHLREYIPAPAKPAHTPGPWKFYDDEWEFTIKAPWGDNVKPGSFEGYGDYRGGTICKIEHQGENAPVVTQRQAEANARLIAAAPTMLQALKDLTAQIQLGKLNIRKDFSLMNAHAAATKAIFQAEGE